jgi:hypothetical protein
LTTPHIGNVGKVSCILGEGQILDLVSWLLTQVSEGACTAMIEKDGGKEKAMMSNDRDAFLH